MRLTLKLTSAVFLAVLLVVAWHSYFSFERQMAQFEQDVRAHHQQLGSALAAAVATAWRLAGPIEARAVVESANANQSDVQIRWVALDGAPGAETPPFSVPDEVLGALAAGQTVSVRPPENLPEGRVYTYVPVPVAAPLGGAVEISQSLERHRDFAMDSLRQSAVATAVLALAIGVVALFFGSLFVARPTQALVQLSERIAAGDLSARLRLRQKDELGLLAQAMNGMSAKLSKRGPRSAPKHSDASPPSTSCGTRTG